MEPLAGDLSACDGRARQWRGWRRTMERRNQALWCSESEVADETMTGRTLKSTNSSGKGRAQRPSSSSAKTQIPTCSSQLSASATPTFEAQRVHRSLASDKRSLRGCFFPIIGLRQLAQPIRRKSELRKTAIHTNRKPRKYPHGWLAQTFPTWMVNADLGWHNPDIERGTRHAHHGWLPLIN